MLRTKNSLCASILDTVFFLRTKRSVFGLVVFFLGCLGVSIFHKSLRNQIYAPYIKPAWRDIATEEIFKIRFVRKQEPDNFVLTCDTPSAPPNDALAQISKFCRKNLNNISAEQTREMLSRGLGRYIPALTEDQKISAMSLYTVASKALEGEGVGFFLTAGSLLGAVRHGGFVPWDDDFDLGIDVRDLFSARKALGCIPGTNFTKFTHFHWKLHPNGLHFPFIDVLFYENNGRYVRALTYYIANSFIYLHENVFPLTRMEFEGCMTVPVPGKGQNVVKRIYNYNECMAYKPHVTFNNMTSAEFPNAFERTNVPCTFLIEFYKFNYLDV